MRGLRVGVTYAPALQTQAAPPPTTPAPAPQNPLETPPRPDFLVALVGERVQHALDVISLVVCLISGCEVEPEELLGSSGIRKRFTPVPTRRFILWEVNANVAAFVRQCHEVIPVLTVTHKQA